jgi:hypothetical protein
MIASPPLICYYLLSIRLQSIAGKEEKLLRSCFFMRRSCWLVEDEATKKWEDDDGENVSVWLWMEIVML